MTTLVTGAAGFLGSHVARQLVARGEDVRVLVRASSSNRAISDLSLEYVTGDLRDAASLERAMNGVVLTGPSAASSDAEKSKLASPSSKETRTRIAIG